MWSPLVISWFITLSNYGEITTINPSEIVAIKLTESYLTGAPHCTYVLITFLLERFLGSTKPAPRRRLEVFNKLQDHNEVHRDELPKGLEHFSREDGGPSPWDMGMVNEKDKKTMENHWKMEV